MADRFMDKLLDRKLHYTLSCWWFTDQSPNNPFIGGSQAPRTHMEAAEIWIRMLTIWKQRFGFDGLVYADLANEVPYFLPGFMQRLKDETGVDWGAPGRFTASIYGDVRWLDVPVRFDCLDVHFYANANEAWVDRTCFCDCMPCLFTDASWHKELSERCIKTQSTVAPMLRAR